MIWEERIHTFIDSLESDKTEFLEKLEKDARERYIPVIRREEQSYLRFMLTLTHPQSILEIGSAIGFSAILMAEYGPADSRITTIEYDEERACEAEKNFTESGYADRITLLRGDATEILKELDGPYDLIFMDAAKGQYIFFLPEVLRIMHPGSLLITDNILQGGDILESHYAVERRNRTIHKRMREYLARIKHDPVLDTAIIPLGDGLAVSVMK